MKTICLGKDTVKGIDISAYQQNVDWAKLVATGVKFAFIKATEGLYYHDAMFASHWANAKSSGILRGPYHYFHPSLDPLQQAEMFCNVFKRLEWNDLPAMLDWESTDNAPEEVDKEGCLVWLAAVEKLTGKRPIIYTGPYFAQELGLDERFKIYKTAIAHYGVQCPLIPAPWDEVTFWQNAGDVPVEGVIGALGDTDIFNGTIDDLRVFVQT